MARFPNHDFYLRYGDKPKGRAQAVLWPVLVFRVLYPDVKRPQLNLFQKTVLRLIQAKTVLADDISDLTGLHKDLVTLILAQLISRDWLTSNADSLTESGIALLKDEDDEKNIKMTSGFLFQDAITGKLWPRLETRISILEANNPNDKFPEFFRNRKTGKSTKPFILNYDRSEKDLPSTSHLLTAWQEYNNDHRASRQLYGSSQLPKLVKLNNLHYQSETAEPAYIITWITPSNNRDLWTVNDPFDIRQEAWWLKSTFQNVIKNNPNLLKRLAKLIGQAEPENQTAEEWLNSMEQEASLALLQKFPWAEKEPDLADAIEVLLRRNEMISGGQAHKNELEAAITECQKLLEVLMQYLIKQFPANQGAIPKVNTNGAGLNLKLLQALDLPAFTQDIVEILARQNLKLVIKATSQPTASLKALLFAAALTTINNKEHPFKTLSASALDLQALLKLADLRNQAGHGNSKHTGRKYQDITTNIAISNIEFTLKFVNQFKEWI
ncbi:conserved hypothetical protein [Oleispira antarctica RB-8]|uniref:Uncharacterized protein n=1 Tax=Oleispira antarctica RB-8 TaxID=698738 RepID=R4YUG7_OLEAN|nr:conserved hypothetical protein [Oleispira antarctica RB-8]